MTDTEREALAQAKADLSAGANTTNAWDAIVAVTDAYLALFMVNDPSPAFEAYTDRIADFRRRIMEPYS